MSSQTRAGAELEQQTALENKPLAGWPALPTELRLPILDELEKQLSSASNHYVRTWASVSKEWRSYFEPLLWRTLIFRSSTLESGLAGLREIMADHRRSLVRKISLHIDLESYTCEECDQRESRETMMANNARFSDAMIKLFSVLASWPSHDPGDGIALELSASSPSDARHLSSSPKHERCERSRSPGYSLTGVEQRLLGNLLTLTWPFANMALAPIPIIHSFVVKQKLCRSIRHTSMEHILGSLPSLRNINYEPWLGIEDQDIYNVELVSRLVLKTSSRPDVRRISVWLAQNRSILESESDAFASMPENYIISTEAVRSSYNLQELAVSHAVDAENFLQYWVGLPRDAPSPKIEHLALTYPFRHLAHDPVKAIHLIKTAAQAARWMPRIKILEVWAGGTGEGFFFRYQVKEDEVKLTVGATWKIPLSDAILSKWEKVVSRHHPGLTLQSVSQRIDPAVLTKPESICEHLELYHLIRQW
ncbi:F-box domain-containing protein [Colletotrichum higginsianum IMI 349063]|uniref:F-box domain-containing protein n=1 Tax=Colletotrichum higginsianum (strain IMI 349063) TaxID=759273 RepID=A0A1B7YWG2_COLHI|nr:F-box domain-containing protein [Colletotrichum higginsianum IMI 349063]OBR16385.1 F-box domain-containing protein [Colletotrichum higginsianum IMI 349063]